jgi:hypothetical protein
METSYYEFRDSGRAFDNYHSVMIVLYYYFVEEGGVANVVRNT